jgi:hypothetical protein
MGFSKALRTGRAAKARYQNPSHFHHAAPAMSQIRMLATEV